MSKVTPDSETTWEFFLMKRSQGPSLCLSVSALTCSVFEGDILLQVFAEHIKYSEQCEHILGDFQSQNKFPSCQRFKVNF
jgi:hypothetical protein